MAEDGTLVPPGPSFQSVCTSLGGTNAGSYPDINGNFTMSPACLWNGISYADYDYTAYISLVPYCSTPLVGGWFYGSDPDYLGCKVVLS